MPRSKLAMVIVFACMFPVVAGCGSGGVKVSGVVKLDGQAVSGATVTFVGDTGKSASGMTMADGAFTLSSPSDPEGGIPPGTYRVTVTKSAGIAGAASGSVTPGSPEYMKMMKAMQSSKKTGSELPMQYAEVTKTPLKVEVPPPTQPVELNLTSK